MISMSTNESLAQTDMTCLHSVKCCSLSHLQETELSLPHLRKVQTIKVIWVSENCQTRFVCSIDKHVKAEVQHMHANTVSKSVKISKNLQHAP